MSDDALISWLQDGAPLTLSAEEQAARRRNTFSLRFSEALYPKLDLGETEEAHQLAIARNVYAVHRELSAFGEEDYSAVWGTLSASDRRAIKAYVALCGASQ